MSLFIEDAVHQTVSSFFITVPVSFTSMPEIASNILKTTRAYTEHFAVWAIYYGQSLRILTRYKV